MAELIHKRELWLVDVSGRGYDRALVFAEPQRGGTWEGWIEFVSMDGDTVVRTQRETTQSNLEGVAYWATGLELTYLEGALRRAMGVGTDSRPERRPAPPRAGSRVARLEVETRDPEVPFRLMATRTLVPGARRHIHNAGALLYEGMAREPSGERPGCYRFVAQCGPGNAAAAMANTVWNDVHGRAATLRIDGAPVPLHHTAIRDALVGAHLV